MIQIRVKRRHSDWYACLAGNGRVWGAGDKPDDAIGNLIRCHPEHFQIEIIVEQEGRNEPE